MGAYLIRRLLLVIPTLWAIITINFFIVQIAPGGPVDQAIAAIEFGNAGVLPGAGGEGVRASHAQTGGSYFDLFPLRGLVSANFDSLPWYQKITDYLWHITLPVLATVIGGFAALTMLTKNSFLDEVRKQYVVTARAKGVSEKNILWKHVFRNAMLLVIAGFPATFISMFFTGSLLIEVMFSLNGLGLLGYEATVSRDYPVMFGTLYIFTLIGLLLNIVSDISYTLVDPRIDFEGR